MTDQTFLYEVAERVHVAVHGTTPPRDDEWTAYLEDVAANLDDVAGVIVHTAGAGPSAAQRRAATEHWRRIGKTPKLAVLTRSKVVRGMVGTLSFFLGNEVRAFAFDDFDSAGQHLGLTPAEISAAKRVAARLRTEL